MKLISLGCYLIFLGISGFTAQNISVVVSDQAGWHRIYRTSLDSDKNEKEIIVLLSDRFSALRFDTQNNGIQLSLIRVLFEDASIIEFKENAREERKGIEHFYELKENKKINRIFFVYHLEEGPPAKEAELQIWGRKD